MNYLETYESLYHKSPDGEVFCPYRILPLGAHIDYQYGKIHGLAIDKGIHIAYSAKKNGVIELCSLNFPKRAQFHIRSIEQEKVGDWADHLRGATLMLSEKHTLSVGMSAVIEGELPIVGLSSSAAVIIDFLVALCRVNHIQLEPMELILMAKAAENKYVGVNCGKLDQSCEVLCRENDLAADPEIDEFIVVTNHKFAEHFVRWGETKAQKGHLAVPPFYFYRREDVKRIPEALAAGCGADAPGSFAAWLSRQVPMHTFVMPGKRYDVGDVESYRRVCRVFEGK